MRKHRRLRKPLRIALEVLACAAVFIGMIAIGDSKGAKMTNDN